MPHRPFAEAESACSLTAKPVDENRQVCPSPAKGPLSSPPTLSVIVPLYNEELTVLEILHRLLAVSCVAQVIVVDDGSTDQSLLYARKAAARDARVQILRHRKNYGKGTAVRTAIPHVREPIVVTQDADLECDPQDLKAMLVRFSDPTVHVVYGVRQAPSGGTRSSVYAMGCSFLTWVTNRLYGTRLTDEPTCYKMLRSKLLRELSIQSRGFEYCPEVTAKAVLLGYSIHEVPIHYMPRTRREGKKIRFRDALLALWTLIRLRVAARKSVPFSQSPEGFHER